MVSNNSEESNLEKCMQLFKLNGFEKKNLITIFDLLRTDDFSQINNDLVNTFIGILIACLEHENINLEEKTIRSVSSLFKKHRTMHLDVFTILARILPFTTINTQLHKLFVVLKDYLELGNENHRKCIMLLIKIADRLGDNEKNILYETILAKVLTQESQIELAALVQLSIAWLNVDKRKKLFSILLKYMLDDKSDDRNTQKNCVGLIISIFDRLADEEKQNIFEDYLLPLLRNRNIFVKQAVAEIVRSINYPLSQRIHSLILLLKDEEYEVSRFGVSCLGDCIRDNPQEKNMDSFSNEIIDIFFQQKCKNWFLIETLVKGRWIDDSKISALLTRFFNLISTDPVKYTSCDSIESVITLMKFIELENIKQIIFMVLKNHLNIHDLYDETIAYIVGEIKAQDNLRLPILNQLINNNKKEVKEAAMQYVVFKQHNQLVLRDLTVLEKKTSIIFMKDFSKIQIRYTKIATNKKSPDLKKNNEKQIAISTLHDKLPQQFKEELRNPHTFRANLIKGLYSDNDDVFWYSYRWLYLNYVAKGSLESKIKWFNIILKLLQSVSSDNYLPYEQIITDVTDDLVPIKEIYLDVIKILPIIIHNKKHYLSRNEEYLLFNLLKYENNELIKDTENIILDINYAEQLKISLLMQVARSIPATNSHLIQLYIKIFNNLDGPIRLRVSELIREVLSYFDSKDVSNELLKIICTANPNTHDEETIEHIIRFILHLISKVGGNDLGKYAICCLDSLLANMNNISLVFLLYYEIFLYDIANLSVLQTTIELVNNKITTLKNSNLYNCAWSHYMEGNYQPSLSKINRLIKSKQDKKQIIPYSLIFLKVCILVELNCWLPGKKLINTHIDAEYDYSLYSFLEGTFKLNETKTSEAIELYKQAWHTNSYWLAPLMQLHYLYFQKGNFDESARYLKEIIKLNPRFKPHYPQYRLSYEENTSEIYVPYAKSIPFIEIKINEFIDESISILTTKKGETSQKMVKDELEILKGKLKQVFKASNVDNLLIDRMIPWNEFFNFPKQIKRWMQDLLINLIHEEIPPSFHKEYNIFRDRINNMKDLSMQIYESGIQRLIPDMDAKSFLSKYAKVLTICDFIKQYAFKDTLKDGYLLGLSNDISEAYNILTSALGLKHWAIAYEELGIEALEASHTEKFMTKLLQQDKPIIMLLPILPTSDKSITLDEVNFLIQHAQKNDFLKNVIFVLDAYNFLPMFILKKGIYRADKISPGQSFAAVLNYLGQILEIDTNELHSWLKPCLEHMLRTQIEKNLYLNVPEERSLYDDFFPSFKDFLNNKIGFGILLEKLITSLNNVKGNNDAFKIYIGYLTLLDTLLFSDIPWFGSTLQPSLQDLILLLQVQKMVTDKLSILEEIINNSLHSSYKYNPSKEQIKTFLNSLHWLLLDVEKGFEWLGISNYEPIQNNKRNLASSYPVCRLMNLLNKSSLQPTQARQIVENIPPKSKIQDISISITIKGEKKISYNLLIGEAVNDGDCFFDSLAHSLNYINGCKSNSIKSLRLLCYNFYMQNKNLVAKWDQGEHIARLDKEDDYHIVQYTYEEVETSSEDKSLIWGRPWVEGIILCRKFKLKGILVIELLESPESQLPVLSFHIVTNNAYENISEETAQRYLNDTNIPILIVEQRSLHFTPALRITPKSIPAIQPRLSFFNESASKLDEVQNQSFSANVARYPDGGSFRQITQSIPQGTQIRTSPIHSSKSRRPKMPSSLTWNASDSTHSRCGLSQDLYDKLFPNQENKKQWDKAVGFMNTYNARDGSQEHEFEGMQAYFSTIKNCINRLKTWGEEPGQFKTIDDYLSNVLLEGEQATIIPPVLVNRKGQHR